MAGLEAGQNAGGQTIGKRSAALLVRTVEGAWQDVDLRVDASAEPIVDLRRLLEQHYALQAIIRPEHAAKNGANDAARTSLSEALRRSCGWDRIRRRAARLAIASGDADRAMDCLGVFASINPAWARIEMQDEIDRPLRDRPLFKAWIR